MSTILTLDSARLRLRAWRDDDLPAFAALNADPQVMRYFPATMTAEESHAQAERIRGPRYWNTPRSVGHFSANCSSRAAG